jgi:hypothetical protein
MTAQLDMFAACTPTFPPHLDPARACGISVEHDIDRDHVGENEIGKLGNNRHVWLVIVYDADGEPLNADQFPDTDAGYKAATARENELQTILSRNRQAMLF